MTTARSLRLHQWLLQGLAALAVGASGFASLGTTDCTELYTLTASRTVVFADDDEEHWVLVRVSPASFESLTLTADAEVVLEQVEPPPSLGGTGGTGGTSGTGGTGGILLLVGGTPGVSGAGSSRGGAESGAAGSSTTGGGLIGTGGASASGGYPPSNVVEITRDTSEPAPEYRFRIQRGAEQGAFGVRFEAVLRVMGGCYDYRPEHMEVRVELQERADGPAGSGALPRSGRRRHAR